MENDRPFEPPKNRLKLTAYVLSYPRQFWLQAAGGIVYNTVVVLGAIFLGKAIDAANMVLLGQAPLSFFYTNLFGFLGFTILFQFARYFKRYYMRIIVNRMKCDIRAGLLSAFFRMPLAALNGEKVGDMMSPYDRRRRASGKIRTNDHNRDMGYCTAYALIFCRVYDL